MNCKHIWLLAIGLAAFQTMGQNPAPASANNTNVPVMPDIHKASYAIGESMGADLKSHFAEINLDDLFTGIKETMTGKPKYSESELRIILNDFTRAYQYQRIEKHKNDEKAFLSKNGKEPGVITLSNGLQYLVISNGTGALPGTNDLVTVTFRATHLDGAIFDYNPTPVVRRLAHGYNGFVGGVVQALQMMKTGSKWKLVLPADLAYGQYGDQGLKVEPYEAVIFEMELVSTEPAPPQVINAAPSPTISSGIIKVPSKEGMEKGEKVETIDPSAVPAAK